MISTPKPNLKSFFPTGQSPQSLPQYRFISFLSNSHNNSTISFPKYRKPTEPTPKFLKPLLNPTKNPHTRSLPLNNCFFQVGDEQIFVLCGLGYWVQGFRCFPWLALNFYLKDFMNLHPSTLQLVQSSANLPMVAKPLYGILSDAIYIGDAHRVPYISIGVLLQMLSWGALALIPVSCSSLPAQMTCILLSNLGASITEIASDALVAELGKKHRCGKLQSYAFMALATGGILGNLFGGIILLKSQQPTTMLLIFSLLLGLQLAISLTTKEESFISSCPNSVVLHKPILKDLNKQFSNLVTAIGEQKIFRPLAWIVASIAIVPILSGSIFYFQTQFLKIDPSIIGLSKLIGQLILLSAAVFYDRFLKKIPMRKLIFRLQIMYAFTILLDLFLVKQINLQFGISNQAYVLCLSALAETIAQFKILPFTVLLAKLCPPGCEGSLLAFFTSTLCLSSIFSCYAGVALASFIGVSAGDYSSLPIGIFLQFIAALVPLAWISQIPITEAVGIEERIRRGTRVS